MHDGKWLDIMDLSARVVGIGARASVRVVTDTPAHSGPSIGVCPKTVEGKAQLLPCNFPA